MLEVSPQQPQDQSHSQAMVVGVFLGALCVQPGLCAHLSISVCRLCNYHLFMISMPICLLSVTYLPACLPPTHLLVIPRRVSLASSFPWWELPPLTVGAGSPYTQCIYLLGQSPNTHKVASDLLTHSQGKSKPTNQSLTFIYIFCLCPEDI